MTRKSALAVVAGFVAGVVWVVACGPGVGGSGAQGSGSAPAAIKTADTDASRLRTFVATAPADGREPLIKGPFVVNYFFSSGNAGGARIEISPGDTCTDSAQTLVSLPENTPVSGLKALVPAGSTLCLHASPFAKTAGVVTGFVPYD